MADVPALHIRDVPGEVVEALRERARSSGRSLNAELVALLAEEARRYRERGTLTRRLAEIAARVNLPPDAPRPEDLIREDRDSR
ncbi:MAG TPA: Arc family DNA-binding protein [Gaiellaceae bacterium]|nr:Arc family DNA-binding protein [Gaiellaceae bacterium]